MNDNRSTEAARSRRSRRIAGFCLMIWTALVLFAIWWLVRSNGQSSWVFQDGVASSNSAAERVQNWFRLFHLNFQRIYPWLLLAPYVGWLGLRFALERGRLHLSLPIHLAGCAIFAVVSQAILSRQNTAVARVVFVNEQRQAIPGVVSSNRNISAFQVEVTTRMGRSVRVIQPPSTNPLLPGAEVIPPAPRESLGGELTNLFPELSRGIGSPPDRLRANPLRPLSILLDLLAYGAVAGLAHSVHFYRRYRERERRALFLESNLAKARLSALQAQLQPHFLFNSLNAILTLLRRDPRAAESTLTSLSELLRLALSQSDRQESTLREELNFLERYLDIQRTRFSDRLRFDLNVDAEVLDALVPVLVLQPLVENAIRHGIEPAENAGLVRVTGSREDNWVILTVEDDGVGPGSEANKRPATGIGLANLRERLEALYGEKQKLELKARPGGGTFVRIQLPWRVLKDER